MLTRSARLALTAVAVSLAAALAPLPPLSPFAPASARAQETAPTTNVGRAIMADELVSMAQVRARTAYLPPEIRIREPLVLLQAARRLAPDSLEVARNLAMAASSAGEDDVARDALRDLIRLDPGNLFAQVNFIDLVARGKTVDEQLQVYRATFNKTQLDPQVRSEIATRIGHLLLQRGEKEEAVKTFQQAIALNDVNVGAWQALCVQLMQNRASAPDCLQGFVGLLLANPFQPDALIGGARLLAQTNQHHDAANWYVGALEQAMAAGKAIPPEAYLDMAMEMACANRRAECEDILRNLLAMEQSPTAAALMAYVLRAPTGAAPGPENDPLLDLLRKRLAAASAADPKNDQALADVIWLEVFLAPKPAPAVEEQLAALKALVGPDNLALQRLTGWHLLRQGKTAEAKAVLDPIGPKDPYAMLGLIRLAEARSDAPFVRAQIQDLYNAHPSGFVALHILLEARKEKVELKETALGQSMKEIVNRYPDNFLMAQRRPRDLVLIQPTLPKRRFQIGEPVYLTIKMINSTDRPLSVGINGAFNMSVGLGASIRGLGAGDLGVFANENNPRVYRVERRGSIQQTVRIDQGEVRQYLYRDPSMLLNLNLWLITAPRLGPDGTVVPGLGGQKIPGAGAFERQGVGIGGAEGAMRLVQGLQTASVDHQMLFVAAFESIAYTLPEDRGDPTATGPRPQITLADVRSAMINTVVQQISRGDELVQAWTLRRTSPVDVPPVFADPIASLRNSPSWLVRLCFAERLLDAAGNDMTKRTTAAREIRNMGENDKDELVKRWCTLLAAEAEIRPPEPTAPETPPATQPTPPAPSTTPSATPSSAPATAP